MSLSPLAARPLPSRARRARPVRFLGMAFVLALAGRLPAWAPAGVTDVVDRAIRAGDVHEQPVKMSAGDFLDAVVDQDGVDVIVELFDAAGNKVTDADSVDTTRWQEEIAWTAERAGTFRLVVRPLEKDARPGRYRLRIDGPRPARPEDARRAEAAEEMRAALAVLGQHELRLAHLEKALAIWRGLGAERREAETLCQIGSILGELGRNEEANARLHESAGLFAGLGLDRGRAFALLLAARSDHALLRDEEGLAHLQEALAVARREKDRWLEARVLYNLGRYFYEHQPRTALLYLEPAHRIARENGDRDMELRALYQMGYAHDDLGETQEALRCYNETLTLARAHRHAPTEEFNALNSLGFLYGSLGHDDEASSYYRQALALSRAMKDPFKEGATLNNLALLAEARNELDQADALYLQALDLGRQSGSLEVQVKAINNRAFLSLRRDDAARALELSGEALELAAGDHALEMSVRNAMGVARRKLGDLEGSRKELGSALAMCRELQDRGRESILLLELALTEREAGDLRKSLATLEQGIEIVESLRTNMMEEDLRTRFLASRSQFYDVMVDTLMALHRAEPAGGFDARALEQSERVRARSLIDLLAEAGAEVREGADPGLAERERRLRSDIEALEKSRLELLSQGASSQAAEASGRLEDALKEYRKVESELRVSSPRYAALTQPETLTVDAIQHGLLDPGTLLLEYSLGEERSFLWAVSPDSLRCFDLPPRRQIQAAARRYYGAVTLPPDSPEGKAAQADLKETADELSRLLLRPVEALLSGQTLLVVADGALHYLPFGALPTPASLDRAQRVPLVQSHVIVSLPSASVLAVLRRELAGRPAAPKTLAVVADPVFRRDDQRVAEAQRRGSEVNRGGEVDPSKLSRLRFSRREAEAIAQLVPAAQRLEALGFAATRAAVTGGELSNYRLVHFATHGLIDSRRPDLSTLVLSLVDERGRPQNGFLRLDDVYNLKLKADLVVLSACQTALGQEIRGEGLIGLTRGFMYAGAARVAASLWSVDDRATSILMEHFYRHMLSGGMSPAAALRQAQIEMAADPRWRPPYYWAGFSLQGEWR